MADDTMQLSAIARRRMSAMLPELLSAVRARRRRRHVRRAATVALLVGAPIALWWGSASAPPATPRNGDVAAAPPAVIVDTDPAIVARCTVATVERSEWYVDDAGLQELLRADERDAGLVRIGERVLVSASAIDPWPSDGP